MILKFINKVRNKFFPKAFNSSEYWESRYKNGGNSGAGSYNKLAEFKAEFLNKFVADNNIKKVIEWGSGDGNQATYYKFNKYLGIDISKTAVEMCKLKFKDESEKEFVTVDEYDLKKSDLSMSLDVIYHLTEDDTYERYMKNLFDSSYQFVIVYSSNSDDNKDNNSKHVKHRVFTNWVKENTSFKLVEKINNKYVYSGDNNTGSLADFYVFQLVNG